MLKHAASKMEHRRSKLHYVHVIDFSGSVINVLCTEFNATMAAALLGAQSLS